jgi:hypothetical protein
LAIARWGGAAGTTLSIDDERGAPVPEQRATIENDTATFDVYLDTPASQGQTMRYFVDAGGTLTAKQESEDVVALHNTADSENPISVTYAPASGSSHTVERTLVAGEKVRARLVGGEASLAGPELEPLLHGQSALESLLHGCAHHGRGKLRRNVRATLWLIEGALAEARAETPDTRHAARLVALALDRLSEIVRRYHLRACERLAIEQARQALEEAQALAYGVMSWIAAMGRAQPGEPLTLRITFYNRGSDTAHHGTLSLVPPPDWMGWTESAEAFEELAPGETAVRHITVTAPTTATPDAAADIQAQTTYFVRECIHHHGQTRRCFDSERQSLGSLRVTIEPLFSLSVLTHELPLAPGGYNEGHIGLSNWTTRTLEILLTATPPPGALVGEPHTVVVPALSTVVALLPIAGVGLTTGSGSMTVVASIDTGVQAEGSAVLRFSDDLALNPMSAPWPQISAISSQPAYPPTLASDGSDSTFWVSGGTVSGEGPTPANPHWLMVDFGAQVSFGSVTMVPRPGYGPTAYTIEISDDGTSWLTVASEPTVANETHTTTFEDALAGRYLRLDITGSWDWQQPPRNVQVASLRVQPPEPGDLAANTTGAPYPLGFASSSQASYPPSLAFDADAGTFWVSGGSSAGEGPSPAQPEYLGVDFGSPLPVGSVVVVPRVGYGPTALAIEVSDDGVSWITATPEMSIPNDTHTILLGLLTTRMIRLRITGSWDWVEPPRNVQIVSMRVHSP